MVAVLFTTGSGVPLSTVTVMVSGRVVMTLLEIAAGKALDGVPVVKVEAVNFTVPGVVTLDVTVYVQVNVAVLPAVMLALAGVGPEASVAVAPPVVFTLKLGGVTPVIETADEPTFMVTVATLPDMTSVGQAFSSTV